MDTRPPYAEPEFIEFEGLILYGRPEGLPTTIHSYRERWPDKEDWRLESFFNHYHWSNRNGEETCLRNQFADAEQMSQRLRATFHLRSFVFRIEPLSTSSFYQASDGAQTSDGGEWEPNGPLSGVVLQNMLQVPGSDPASVRKEAFDAYRERSCERCKARWSYEYDYLREEFPGTRWADCPKCDQPNVTATQTLWRIIKATKEGDV